MSQIDNLLQQLAEIHEQDCGPFPYRDCRYAISMAGGDASLIPDLDLYRGELAGYRSWGRRTLRWSDRAIEGVLKYISRPFFVRHPAHARLESILRSDACPDSNRVFIMDDRSRAVLGELLHAIQTARKEPSPPEQVRPRNETYGPPVCWPDEHLST